MKRIKNADINFKLNPKRINLNNFSMKFYTVNSEAYFFIKDQDNVVSVEREATIYDDPEVIISGGTIAVDYYLPLDWSELVQLGEGVLNYRCINNIEDPFFPDLVYNQVVEDTTAYYIDSDIHIDPADDKNLIERVVELESNLAVETADREDADVFLSGAVDTEIARAISAETELSERIDAIESGASEALDAEIERAISAETALQDAIDAEEARAIAIENAIRQDLTDESELRSSADTAMWTAINDEIVRSTSAETAIDNKVEVETLRAIGVENAISGDLQTYKATNNAALQAETTRATSAETALQSAINDEATARANADTALQTAITNEVSRAREAESGITNSLNAEVTRATGAENALDDKIDAETTRATGAEAALDVKIGTISGNVITETTRATTAENALSGAIDTLDVRFFDDAKYEDSGNTKVINFYNGNVVKATIDCTDFLVDGMIDDVRIEAISGVTYLVIDFNTASGKEDIKIPLTDIFNPANYYTKSETSGATEIANALALKLNISDFNTYSGAVDTAINSKAAQSAVDALNGVVTAHTADTSIHVTSSDKEKWNKVDDKADTTALTAVNDALTAHTADTTIHLTSGNVQTQIDNSISGKANSSDVYLKGETSGATELATAFAATQPKLIPGSGITIDSANTISCTATGGGTVDETTIYVRYTGSYENYDFATYQIKYALFDYLGDKTAATAVTADITVYDITTYDASYLSATFDYTTGTYTKSDPNNMLDIVYDSDIEDYKVSITSSYPNCVLSRILFWDAYIKIPAATIESGDTADVIEGSVADIISDLYEKDLDYLKNCYFMTNSKDKLDISYSTERASNITNSSLWLDDLKVENRAGYNHLSTNINIPLGTSGWTEIDTSSNSCQIGDGNSNLGFTTFRITCDSNSLGNCNISANMGYNGSRTWDYIAWDYGENTFIRQPGWSPDIFSAATLNWDAQNYVLTVTYPESITVDDTTYETEFTILGSSSCSFGSSITKVEKYGELQQSIKPYVQQLRADVNTISGQVATKQDTLIAGSNITISGNVISATGGGGGSSYTAGDGIDITNDVISVTGKVDTLTYNTYTAATATALASKQTTLTAGTGISIIDNVISATGGGITSGEVQTMITSATTPICQTIEDNEQVTAQALNVLNGELANKLDVSAYTPVDLSNYYTKSETSGATEISTALASKANSSDVYLKSETSGATELSNAFAQKLGISDFNTYSGAVDTALSGKQATLVSSENIKTINNQSLLGSGNIDIQGGGGSITVDSALDSGSTNAVANSAITNAINTVSGDSVCNCRDIPNVESGASEILTVFETNSGGILPNGIYRRFRMPLYIDTTDDYRLKLAINTAVTSASTDSQVPSAKAVYDAIQEGGSGGITSGEVQTMIDQSISGKTNQSDFTGHTTNTSIHVTTAQTAAWDAKSDFSGSYNDLTDKPTIPTVPTSNTAFTNDAGYITANDITGKTDVTAFTAHTGDTTIHVTSSDKTSWNGAVTALGGLSLVKLTQAQYDALSTKDNNTLYVIVG